MNAVQPLKTCQNSTQKNEERVFKKWGLLFSVRQAQEVQHSENR